MGSLVIGASGLVGASLFREIQSSGKEVIGTYHQNPVKGMELLDVTDEVAFGKLLDCVQPDVIYYPAANPNVEWIEENPLESALVNVEPVRFLTTQLQSSSVKLVYYSTDYVFDGVHGPYVETEKPTPICEYGKQKLQVERLICNTLTDYLIFRVTVVYGWETRGKNFAHRLVSQLRSSDISPIRVPDDQMGNPSYSPNIARAAVSLTEKEANGIFHLAGDERASRYDFACAIADAFSLPKTRLVPVKTVDLHQKAPRPLNAGMIVAKAQFLLSEIKLLGFTDALQCMKESELSDR